MSDYDPPREGDIWHYSYLWHWQDERGETEGRKDRPVSFVATARTKTDELYLFILPITSKEPDADRQAIEIPQTECKRAGLDSSKRLWLILDEVNLDIYERSYFFEPGEKVGSFSPAFRLVALRAFKKLLVTRRIKTVKRFD